MKAILDKDGKPIQRSKNLRGIRQYVGRNIIKVLAIDRTANGEGELSILFENGCSFETNFADFHVLAAWVQRWRNAWGAPLRINGRYCGIVGFSNPHLQEVVNEI